MEKWMTIFRLRHPGGQLVQILFVLSDRYVIEKIPPTIVNQIFPLKCGFGIGYGIGRKYQPIQVSVSDRNQNSGFGRSLLLYNDFGYNVSTCHHSCQDLLFNNCPNQILATFMVAHLFWLYRSLTLILTCFESKVACMNYTLGKIPF